MRRRCYLAVIAHWLALATVAITVPILAGIAWGAQAALCLGVTTSAWLYYHICDAAAQYNRSNKETH